LKIQIDAQINEYVPNYNNDACIKARRLESGIAVEYRGCEAEVDFADIILAVTSVSHSITPQA
jgi:hypothetical protein